MNFSDRAIRFTCHDAWLYGILSVPEQARSRGVLIVVGGPQCRVGSHRQFTLLARHLAAHGVPVMRFDYTGMGDSEGRAKTFEDVEDDVSHAIKCFFKEMPALKELVIWGLCDGASAALFYAHKDVRVTGLVLLNPWVRTDAGAAKTYLKHYYLRRLFAPDLWQKIRQGKFDYAAAASSVSRLLGTALASRKDTASVTSTEHENSNCMSLPDRMLDGLSRFKGRVLLIMSGNDLTAQEFSDVLKGSQKWRKLLESSRIQRHDLPDANHTFAQKDWRDQVANWTSEWVISW